VKSGSTVAPLAELRAPAGAKAEWPALADTIRGLSLRLAGWPAEVEALRRWYEPHLERIHDDAPARKADLMQLEQIAAGYPSRERFLTELTLDPPDATSDEAGAPHRDEDYLILSTIHSAKGQEWSSVFLLNAVDGCIPSDLAAGETEEIEEERRLLYVAMTRAKHQLDLMVPQRFYVHQQSRGGDRHLYALRTRFVPEALLALFEQRTWPVRAEEPGVGGTGSSNARVDIAARLRARWR
jgi:DNA helicase II / ATP-dependent DNA helicase PcrA